ncbi:SPOR domain-containing protein [uncultured Prevotella sp.]|uniref:SPOR domain-containing protein n=1 Tax=uncultured Prevotella sp. TaxID=159272 RepID=UPI0027E336D5|nr:SPOR domain-containing protein [uncultured Prevotella sp.]
MKKSMVLCAGVCVALAFTSCKSKESAYKKMYDKAQAKHEQPAQEVTPVVAPIVEKPATETTVVDNSDNVAVRTEDFTLISGSGLSNFSVVVGSFSVKANAEGLQRQLKAAGKNAQIVFNSERNLYRVVATTFATKSEAAQSRDQLVGQYPGAWLLYKK